VEGEGSLIDVADCVGAEGSDQGNEAGQHGVLMGTVFVLVAGGVVVEDIRDWVDKYDLSSLFIVSVDVGNSEVCLVHSTSFVFEVVLELPGEPFEHSFQFVSQ